VRSSFLPTLNRATHVFGSSNIAFAGSDVAGIRTTAVLTADKKHFLVNGCKKWITTGMHADYFTTAVRTGPKTLSMLLIPRMEGVETRSIKTSYSSSAGTAYVTFDDVLVPVENLIGELDKGFKIVLSNFNHERLVMCHFTIRQMRKVTEEAFIWAHSRKAFGECSQFKPLVVVTDDEVRQLGKSLIDQPVLRAKFAKMFAKCDSNQAWLEHITYQMCNMSYDQQSTHLAGPISLLKAHCTSVAEEIISDCVNIFGGRGVTKGGLGGLVEMMHRTSKFDAILGGSEEGSFSLFSLSFQKEAY
jgi:alkylation response protein AidB-like acyl-CoA dehydrogenase